MSSTNLSVMLPRRFRETSPNQPVYEPIAPVGICACGRALARCSCAHRPTLPTRYRKAALAGGLGSIGKYTAAVLTLVLKIRSLLPQSTAGARFCRLRSERRALAAKVRGSADSLDGIYDTILDRLGNTRSQPSWLRRVVLTAESDYVLPFEQFDPHFLRIESVRDWLSDDEVRADLKALATERILADGADTAAIRARLAQSYARYTSDDPILARVRIDTVLSGLVASALSSLGPSERITVNLVQQSNLRINRTNAEILAAISRIESLAERRCERDTAASALARAAPHLVIGLN
jgi:hypothetical protein